jgi:hypothetical protein
MSSFERAGYKEQFDRLRNTIEANEVKALQLVDLIEQHTKRDFDRWDAGGLSHVNSIAESHRKFGTGGDPERYRRLDNPSTRSYDRR